MIDEKKLNDLEAIEILEALFSDSTDENYPFTSDFGLAVHNAIAALRKQVEVDAEFKWGCVFVCPPDCGGAEYDEYGWIPYCPTCGEKIDDFTTRCKCGQAIKRDKNYPEEKGGKQI